jgi:hypothetical protein
MLRCRPVMLVCVQVAASIDVLIDHPDQWNLLRDNPKLALPAVDETMRHSPIVGATMRITTEDVELAGVVIPAGTIVLTNTAAANRDPAIYDDPNRFGITRQGPSPAGCQTPAAPGPRPGNHWPPSAGRRASLSPSTLRLVAARGPLFPRRHQVLTIWKSMTGPADNSARTSPVPASALVDAPDACAATETQCLAVAVATSP